MGCKLFIVETLIMGFVDREVSDAFGVLRQTNSHRKD